MKMYLKILNYIYSKFIKKKHMKNLLIIVLLVLISTSCEKEQTNENSNFSNTSEDFIVTELNLDLDFTLDDYYDIYFKSSNLNSFNEKFSDELLSNGNFYIINDKDFTFVRISSSEYEKKLDNSKNINQYSKTDSSVTCKTCRSEDCVAKTIKKAVGDGTKTVYMKVKPITTLGVRTGVQVCYSPRPFKQIVFSDLEGVNREDIENIDELLVDQIKEEWESE